MYLTIIPDMEIYLQPGIYIVAVSGGVDSMALLDLLQGRSEVELVVAHFDHGIRADSSEDRKLVGETAEKYGLPFEYEEGKLGPGASEAMARKVRYDFLERVRRAHQAQTIVTAHHQDDLLETAILNLLRGTGRKGLAPLTGRVDVLRPLLNYSKQEILAYAEEHQLRWREDSTNTDDAYLRNYIRHHIISRLSPEIRGRLLEIIENARATNEAMNDGLSSLHQILGNGTTLDRQLFAALPHDVAKEFLASWLRRQGIGDFDKYTLERVAVSAKTKPPGTQVDLLHGNSLLVTKTQLALRMCER